MRLAMAMVAAAGSMGLAKPPADSTIPFELYKGHIFVSASVNGKGPYLFGFDTGASGVGRADASLTAQLALPKVGGEANSDGITTVTTDVVSVDALRVGDLEKRNLRLLSRDYNHGRKDHVMAGIIGRDFFADRLVTIDYPKRRIGFATGSLSASDPRVVAYSGSFVVPVCFASGCYPGKVDTGSSRGIVIPKDLVAKVSGTAPKAIGEAARMNSVATLYEMELTEPVRIGGVTAKGLTILYAEPSDAMINVGSDFLKDYVLTIDQQRKLLKIDRPGS